MALPRNTLCLWFDGTAAKATAFYATTFPCSAVGNVTRAPGDRPDRAAAKRVFDAMMGMRKIDVAAIEAAREG